MWGSEDTWVIPASPAHHRWAPEANSSPSGRAGPSPVSPFPAQACRQRGPVLRSEASGSCEAGKGQE